MSTFAIPSITDQLALELLNSSPLEQGVPVDYLASDKLAADWIVRAAGALVPDPSSAPAGLARKARELRECVRAVVEARKTARAPSLDPLNTWLRQMPSHLELTRKSEKVELKRTQQGPLIMQWLAPFCEATAKLLVDGDFSLVRRCESPDCVLWFYDRTKAHKRRWCSMALCGNRHKVSQFRSRQQS